MSKRAILAAAKRAGVTITDAHYGWQATPGEMVPGWSITFGPELDCEFMEFDNAAEAVEWIDENAAEEKATLESLLTSPTTGADGGGS